MRDCGILFPGKQADVFVAVHDPEASGSLIRINWPVALYDCVKSPCRSSRLGTTPRLVEPATPRKLSQLARKNVLLCPSYTFGMTTGPVKVAPNWLRRSSLLAPSKKLRASNRSLRRNSKTAPWRSLPPLFNAMVTTPPARRPYSDENPDVCNLNSCSESSGGRACAPASRGLKSFNPS